MEELLLIENMQYLPELIVDILKKNESLSHSLEQLDFELANAGYRNSSCIAEAIEMINEHYSPLGYVCKYYAGNNLSNVMGHWIIVQNGKTEVTSINLDQFGCFDCGPALEEMISNIIKSYEAQYEHLLRLVGKINSSANQFWDCYIEECATYLRLKISVKKYPELFTYVFIHLTTMSYEELVYEITKAMANLFISKPWDKIRIMEERVI